MRLAAAAALVALSFPSAALAAGPSYVAQGGHTTRTATSSARSACGATASSRASSPTRRNRAG